MHCGILEFSNFDKKNVDRGWEYKPVFLNKSFIFIYIYIYYTPHTTHNTPRKRYGPLHSHTT